MTDSYAAAGVDTAEAGRGIDALVSILRTIDTGSPSRSVLSSGHFANVLRVAPNLGIALSTDGVGSKLVLAEQTGRLSTVGIDCIAMNVNDVVCVGARPIAVLDYLAVERVDAAALEQIAVGLKRGAEDAGVEIPGGELAVIPELIRGHPSPNGFDLCGACVGTVALDAIVTGADCRPGDVLIGLPSSGLHSNGYTLARRVIAAAGLDLDARPEALEGDALLEPTVIYVRAVLDLLESDVKVHGLAHITGDGVLNLLRLNHGAVGFTIDEPLAVPGICRLVVEHGALDDAEAYEVFNMGCGFVVAVAPEHAEQTIATLGARHPGAARIGEVSDRAGTIALPGLGLEGASDGLRPNRGR
jgi:phosphoribosylformylglycinamidine cyclo-ligase